MKLSLAFGLVDSLHAQAARAAPQEACGLLLGRDDRIDSIQPTRNVHSTPETHFEIDPKALIEAHRNARSGGPQIVGYYHSHPAGSPTPSATDRASAAGDGRIWAIIGLGRVELWRDTPSGFEPVGYIHRAR
jgi:proteasome lid subunit RPN8/RPN11